MLEEEHTSIRVKELQKLQESKVDDDRLSLNA